MYSITFNALTNTTGNTPILYAVNQPSMGSVSNDASGNITYTRNPNLFGDDVFTYILTDANGGYAVITVRIEQQDTSGDGLSDQWDLRYGFDPTANNAAADPDGDDLPNLAEYELGTNPNASDNPLNLSSVTNGAQYSGFVQLPLYGLHPAIAALPIFLYVNGEAAENSSLAQGPDGQWLLNWDTTFLTNGSYDIQVGFQFNPNTPPGESGLYFGQDKTIQISNPIIFDKLTSQFSSYLYVYGTLTDTNDTYDVYLYDEEGNPLVYATGLSAPDGQIALGWDLTDGQGHQISFGNIQAIFYLYAPGNQGGVQLADSQSPTRVHHWFIKDDPASIDNNVFAVAWGWDWYTGNVADDRYVIMQLGVVDILGSPAADNPYFLLPVANIPLADSTFRYDTDSDRQVLMHAINVSENFFFFGHGSDGTYDAISGNPAKSSIVPGDVENLLQNKEFRSTPKLPRRNRHPYFLTILNACNTYSSDWAGAFGVDFGTPHSFDDYVYAGRAPRAFVGWSKFIRVPSNYDVGEIEGSQYGQAVGYMFGGWMGGYPLYYCLSDFSSNALAAFPSFTGADSWQISGCYDLQRGD